MEYFKLIDNSTVPALCFGPGIMTRGVNMPKSFLERVKYDFIIRKLTKCYTKAVESALSVGASFIDYSASYGREDLIAKAMRNAGIERESCVLTTRVPNYAQMRGTVRDVVMDSIRRMDTNYIDILMFHWPVTDHYVKTWKEMIKMKEEGICRTIGVANCHQHHIDTLQQETGVLPSINQVEVHPLFTQKPLLGYCKSKGIVVEAYTPLARMDERMTRLPLLKNMEKKYNKTISQLILRWHVQNGVIPVFRSMNASRQKENYNIFDFALSEEDMHAIDSININSRLRYDPDNCDFSIL